MKERDELETAHAIPTDPADKQKKDAHIIGFNQSLSVLRGPVQHFKQSREQRARDEPFTLFLGRLAKGFSSSSLPFWRAGD